MRGLPCGLLVGVATALWAAACTGGEPRGYSILTDQQLRQQIAASEPMVIVDVREPREFAAGHIPGARLIPYGGAARRVLKELDKDDHVVFVCHTGPMGDELARLLVANGYRHVANLRGGMRGWSGPRVTGS